MKAWVDGDYPNGSRVPGKSAPLLFKHAPIIGVIHTTEGDNIPNYPKGYEPHATYHPGTRAWQQHTPLTQAAYALKAPAGLSTNTWGAIQVEVVGHAASLKDLPADQVADLMSFLRFFFGAAGIPAQTGVAFGGSETYGVNGTARLSKDAWYNYAGWLGHQHVPGNLHWDPGAIPLAAWLRVAPTPPPTPTPSGLAIDGIWGPATTKRLQQVLGTNPDGVVSHQWKSTANQNLVSAQFDKTQSGSTVIRAVQARLGLKQDGLCGPATITALQHHYGTPADGVISSPSTMVKAMQNALNAGTF